MKKVFLAALMLASVSSFAYPNVSNRISSVKHVTVAVPAAVLASFNAMFPTATNVKWQLENEHGVILFQAEFLLNGSKLKVRFTADGNVAATTKDGRGVDDGPNHH